MLDRGRDEHDIIGYRIAVIHTVDTACHDRIYIVIDDTLYLIVCADPV